MSVFRGTDKFNGDSGRVAAFVKCVDDKILSMETLEWMIRIGGLLIAATSFTWSIATWRKSRHQVSVSVDNIVFVGLDTAEGHLIQVTVINKGRDPISVLGWGISLPRGENIAIIDAHPLSARLPSLLGTNTRAVFFVEAVELQRIASEKNLRFRQMKPWVNLSNGQKVFATKSVPLAL